MITTYAVSLHTVDCTEAQRITLIDLVTDWQLQYHPFAVDEEDRPGMSMRVREGDDDPVFRLTITEGTSHSSHVETTTITIMFTDGDLTFDLRITSTPRTSKVAPHRPSLVPVHVAALVRQVIEAVPTYDAGYRIIGTAHDAATTTQGQEIAALILAPQRRLPVIVEIDDFGRNTSPLIATRLQPLIGLAHVFRITHPDAVAGFTEFLNMPLVGAGTVLVHWADTHLDPDITRRHEISRDSEPYEWGRIVNLVTATAAQSLATPRIPPPPRRDIEPERLSSHHNDDATEGDSDLAVHVEQLESTVDELQASLADADRIIAEQRVKLESKDAQLDELVLRNVSLETLAGNTPQIRAVASMAEALRIARTNCPFLIFHERAIESGEALEGPDPMSVLQDLVRLNEVARAWMSGEISGNSIGLACRQMGLNFAPGISATARQKYVEDYVIDWRGSQVVAEAHLKRGKKSHLVRIHVYFDEETHQVVVAYIGRHLRDKTSN